MNYYFITGTSRGIGRALTDLLLNDKNNFVYGISRTQNITHANYQHFSIDLNILESVVSFEFPELKTAETIVLINNSAAFSEIVSFGKIKTNDIIEGYNVNIVSPSILINSFLKSYQIYNCKRLIMNISSGAAKVPIESWSVYCASKAALAMLSEVIDLEQKLKFPEYPVKIFSVGPGVVDTAAQEKIRNTSPEDFIHVGRFIEYKEKNQLAAPTDVANKLIHIINFPEKFENVSFSVKDF